MLRIRIDKYVQLTSYVVLIAVFIRACVIYWSSPITNQEYAEFIGNLVATYPCISLIGEFLNLQIYGSKGKTAIYMHLTSFLPAFVCSIALTAIDTLKHPDHLKKRGLMSLVGFAILFFLVGVAVLYAFFISAPGSSRNSGMYVGIFSPIWALVIPVGSGASFYVFSFCMLVFCKRLFNTIRVIGGTH